MLHCIGQLRTLSQLCLSLPCNSLLGLLWNHTLHVLTTATKQQGCSSRHYQKLQFAVKVSGT